MKWAKKPAVNRFISASKHLSALDEVGLAADKTPDRQRMTPRGHMTAGGHPRGREAAVICLSGLNLLSLRAVFVMS